MNEKNRCQDRLARRRRRSRHRAERRTGNGAAGIRFARIDRGGQGGRQAGLLHREFRRGRAAGHQGVQQALSRDQGRDGARAGRPAHHPRQDRGRGRQADRRRRRSFRSRADAAAGRHVPGLCAAECRRLQSRCADFAQAVAARHAGVVDRLQYRTGEEPAEDLDGSDQARIRQDDRAGVRPVRRHHLDPHHVRAPGAGRGLLGEAGRDPSDPLSLRRADGGFAGARRSRDGPLALQCDLSEAEGRRADQDFLPARRRAGQSLCIREFRRPPRIPMPRNCSSTGACRKRGRPS